MSAASSTPIQPPRRSGKGAGPARIYIIDERESVRHALADRLARTMSVAVVGESGEASQALLAAREAGADVILVEIKRGDGMGLELVRQLSAAPEQPRVVVLTSYPTEWEEAAAKRAGASAYLLKDIHTEELLQHILGDNG
jgi:DNA-binding NarL/FixJ family response regulator